MSQANGHPVDRLTDPELRALMLRVDASGFPADLEQLWEAEPVRYRQTLRRIPPAANDRAMLLDLGSSRQLLPFFQEVLGYKRIVLNTSYPDSGFVEPGLSIRGASPADVQVSVFDVERDPFPHADATFDVVLCLEVIEHLAVDPMAMAAEVNRVLKREGVFVLSTPNALRYASIVNMVVGEQPMGYVGYNGVDTNRHNRLYTPGELERLLRAAGMDPQEVTTFGTKRKGWRRDVLKWLAAVSLFPFRQCPHSWRHDVILAVGRKTSCRVDRRPSWLYYELAERRRIQAEGRKTERSPSLVAATI